MALAVAVIVVERKRDAIPPREERARPEARGGHELEQLLEDAPYRPDVDRAVVRLLQDHLRRTVPPRDHVVGHLRLQWRRHRRVGSLAFDLLAERAARPVGATVRARPKSHNGPPDESNTFAGFRSRWMPCTACTC